MDRLNWGTRIVLGEFVFGAALLLEWLVFYPAGGYADLVLALVGLVCLVGAYVLNRRSHRLMAKFPAVLYVADLLAIVCVGCYLGWIAGSRLAYYTM